MGSVLPILVLLFASSTAFGFGSERLFLGAGVTLHDMGKVTTASDASTSILGEAFLPLTLAYRIPSSSLWTFVPSVSYTPIPVKTTDSISKTLLMGALNGVYAVRDDLELKGGLGLLQYSIGGPGGTIQRSNGTGTSTFALPGTTSASTLLFLNFGIGYPLAQSLRLDLDAALMSALSTRRAISTTLSMSWGVF
jgi:hypothetical protein